MKKRKTYWLTILWVLCLPLIAEGQGWTKTIDRHQMETVTASASVAGGSILAGVYLETGDSVYHYFISKIDALGNTVWHHAEPTVSIAAINRVVILSNGDIAVAGNYLKSPEFFGDNGIRVFVARFTGAGTKVWEKEHRYTYNVGWNIDMELLPNDELLLGMTFTNTSVQPTEGEIMLHKLNGQGDSLTVVMLQDADTLDMGLLKIRRGHNNTLIAVAVEARVEKMVYINLDYSLNVLWTNSYNPESFSFDINDVIPTSDGGYLAVGQERFFDGGKVFHTFASKVDASGDSLWQRRYLLPGGWGRAGGVLEPSPGKYVLACTSADILNGNLNTYGFYRPYTLFLDGQGDVLRYKYYNGPTPLSTATVNTVLRQPDGGFLISGTIGHGNTYYEPLYLYDDDAYLIRTDSLGNIYYGAIAGSLFADANGNCTADVPEATLGNWIITATGAADTYYAITDPTGNYVLEVDTGTYTLSASVPGSYWNNNHCPDSLTAVLASIAG